MKTIVMTGGTAGIGLAALQRIGDFRMFGAWSAHEVERRPELNPGRSI
jgi:hypothetical protein